MIIIMICSVFLWHLCCFVGFYCFCSIVLSVFLLCCVQCVVCRFILANKPLITISSPLVKNDIFTPFDSYCPLSIKVCNYYAANATPVCVLSDIISSTVILCLYLSGTDISAEAAWSAWSLHAVFTPANASIASDIQSAVILYIFFSVRGQLSRRQCHWSTWNFARWWSCVPNVAVPLLVAISLDASKCGAQKLFLDSLGLSDTFKVLRFLNGSR